jgi:hypothetical protein
MHIKLTYMALLVGASIGAYREQWNIFALCVAVMIGLAFMVHEGPEEE